MAIILERYPLPSTGHLRLDITVEADIRISAEEAQKTVSHHLFNDVNYLLWGEVPSLVLSQRTVWRVPVFIGLVGVGRIGSVTTVDVDVESGEVQDITPQMIEKMKQRVQHHVAGQTPATTASG